VCARNRAFGAHEQKLVGSILREYRESATLRQVDVANRLGQPQSFVSKYESGERTLDLLEARLVCRVLGIPIQELIERIEAALAEAPIEK
jgi:transcriptional regulator with XRE-family HTH domain